MDNQAITILITVLLVAMLIAVAVIKYMNNHTIKSSIIYIDLALITTGFFMTGVSRFLVDTVESFISWSQQNQFDLTHQIGLILIAVGIAMILALIVIRKIRRKTAPAAPKAIQQPRTPNKKVTRQQPGQNGSHTNDTDDFSDIEAILKARGIQ